MLGRVLCPRSRYSLVRLTLGLVSAAGLCSLVLYGHVSLGGGEDEVWERSVVRMDHQGSELDELTDDDLVTEPSSLEDDTGDRQTTESMFLGDQMAKEALEFGETIAEAAVEDSLDTEDLHVGVERKEVQSWETEVGELAFPDSPDGELEEDDHIPGLVDDLGGEGRKLSLGEEELEAVARLAEEDLLRAAEEQEWSKLGDVDEAVEWQHEADVDWEHDDDRLEEEASEQEAAAERTKQRKLDKKLQRQQERKKQQMEKTSEDESINLTTEGMTTERTTEMSTEMTTFEATTEETEEELAREEEEEREIFDAPGQRKITRLLDKLGLDGRNRRFRTALETHAKNKTILLTLSDSRYTMMVLNFYETNVLKRGIDNVIFGSLDGKLCNKLDALQIPCFIYARDAITDHDVKLGVKKIFNRKIYYRSRMILEAIAMGYTVLYADVDTVFIRDPFADLQSYCGDCDVGFQMLSDASRRLSWGVNYARPTIGSLYLYYSIARKGFNRTSIALPYKFIYRLTRQERLKLTKLPLVKFRSGLNYFESVKFAWDHRCHGCVSIHSDETHSKEAKMFQLKEIGQWNINFDKYYSSRTRKYIQYDNPYVFHDSRETFIMEMRALRNVLALGQILRRTVILPRFHCFTPPPLEGEVAVEPPVAKWCNLMDLLRIEPFHRWFMGRYREHAFLTHSKVPWAVKKNVSSVYYIGQKVPLDPHPTDDTVIPANVTLIKPRSPVYGAQSEEIRLLFLHEQASVLRLHSLYYGFSHFLSDEIAKQFNRRIKLGFDFRKQVHYHWRRLKVKRPVRPAPGEVAPAPAAIPLPVHLVGQEEAIMRHHGRGPPSAHRPLQPLASAHRPLQPLAPPSQDPTPTAQRRKDRHDTHQAAPHADLFMQDDSPKQSDMFL